MVHELPSEGSCAYRLPVANPVHGKAGICWCLLHENSTTEDGEGVLLLFEAEKSFGVNKSLMMVRGESSSFEEFGKALVVFQTFDVWFQLDPEEGPRETIPSTIALIQPYGREELRVKDVSPFSQEYGNSTGRVIVGLPEGLALGTACDKSSLLSLSHHRSSARMSLQLGQCSMLDKAVTLPAKSTSPPLASAPVKEQGKFGKF